MWDHKREAAMLCARAGGDHVCVRKWVRDRGQTRERDQNVQTNPQHEHTNKATWAAIAIENGLMA
jgi:hypothetical protein